MTKKYQTTNTNTSALAVPEPVNVAMTEIAADMREGLLALAVGTGLQLTRALMDTPPPTISHAATGRTDDRDAHYP